MRKQIRLVLLTLLIGCDTFGPRACTLIGCNSGLFVEVPANVQMPFTVKLRSGVGGALLTVQCTAANRCLDPVFISDYMPEHVTVTVEWSSGSVQRDFTPQYRESRPNGPGCEPLCRQATVSFR